MNTVSKNRCKPGLVLAFFFVCCLPVPAFGDEIQYLPTEMQKQNVELTGTLRAKVIVIGGETTGTVIETKKGAFELDFEGQKELRKQAEKLDGKTVRVTGTLEIRKGVEVKERKIISVTTLVGLDRAAERTVVVPRNNKPFTVKKTDIVRLTGNGIAGAKIEIKVEGPARVQTENYIEEKDGKQPILGSDTREFEIQPTGTGEVTVTITVIPPQPNAQATKTKYQFEVN